MGVRVVGRLHILQKNGGGGASIAPLGHGVRTWVCLF